MSTKRIRVGRPSNLERQIGPIPDYIRKLELDETTHNLINTDTAAYGQWKHDRQSGIDHGKDNPRLNGARNMQDKRQALMAYIAHTHADIIGIKERSASDVARTIIRREASRAKPDNRWVNARGTPPTLDSLRKIIRLLKADR